MKPVLSSWGGGRWPGRSGDFLCIRGLGSSPLPCQKSQMLTDLLSKRSTAGAGRALQGWVLLPELRHLLGFGAGSGGGILFVWG